MPVLEDLLVDSRELNRELTATILLPYLRIDRATGAVVPQPGWAAVSNDARILLYLVARKAMRALGLRLPQEAATPVEIERATGIPGGSVRPALRRLLKSRLVERDIEGSYLVPTYAMIRVESVLSRGHGRVAA